MFFLIRRKTILNHIAKRIALLYHCADNPHLSEEYLKELNHRMKELENLYVDIKVGRV